MASSNKRYFITSLVPAVIFCLISGSIYYLMFQNIESDYKNRINYQLESINSIREKLDEMKEELKCLQC